MRGLRLLPILFLLAGEAPPDLVKWREIAAGEAEARRTKKPILYFMTADWCGPCRILRATVLSDPEMAKYVNREFVPVLVVDRKREEGRNTPEVADRERRYGLEGFPTLIATTPDGEHAVNATGWNGKDETIRFLREVKPMLRDMAAGKK